MNVHSLKVEFELLNTIYLEIKCFDDILLNDQFELCESETKVECELTAECVSLNIRRPASQVSHLNLNNNKLITIIPN